MKRLKCYKTCKHEAKKDLTQGLGEERHWYCPACGSHWYKGVFYNKKNWDTWVNGYDTKDNRAMRQSIIAEIDAIEETSGLREQDRITYNKKLLKQHTRGELASLLVYLQGEFNKTKKHF